MRLRYLELPFILGALALVLGASILQGCGDDDDSPAASAGTSGSGGNARSGLAGADSAAGGSDDAAIVGSGGNTGGTQSSGAAGLDSAAAGTPTMSSLGGAFAGDDPGVGGEGPDQDALCGKFCDDEAVTCTGDEEQYADRTTCLSECSGWALGFVDDAAGNTVYCRIYHLGVAATDSDAASLHCPHTGAHPNSFCLD